jgi:hypothetical protein
LTFSQDIFHFLQFFRKICSAWEKKSGIGWTTEKGHGKIKKEKSIAL